MGAVASMTGFAAAGAATPGATVSVELKSVNARFLELAIRLPDELRALEAGARELLGSRLARGKVDVRVTVTRDTSASEPRLNRAALARLAAMICKVARSSILQDACFDGLLLRQIRLELVERSVVVFHQFSLKRS